MSTAFNKVKNFCAVFNLRASIVEDVDPALIQLKSTGIGASVYTFTGMKQMLHELERQGLLTCLNIPEQGASLRQERDYQIADHVYANGKLDKSSILLKIPQKTLLNIENNVSFDFSL
ncbi:MAG: hypothetical protein KDJ35_05980 [Alphaproteobacteria bacterium]|nr:hypothetical protein [Alphaproteobacteria bacterium]